MGLIDKIRQYNKNKKIEKIKNNPDYILKIKEPSEEFMLTAINSHEDTISKYPNISEKYQLAHIKRWGGNSVFKIVHPTDNVLIEAIKDNFNVFYKLNNPSNYVCKAAMNLKLECFLKIKNVQFVSLYMCWYKVTIIQNHLMKVHNEK